MRTHLSPLLRCQPRLLHSTHSALPPRAYRASPGACACVLLLLTRCPSLLRSLEDDLIDEESAFKGTREFGMAFAHSRGVASIVTMLHIKEHARMPDGRMLINSRGGRRFRIVRVVKERPVLICEVSWFDDAEDAMGEDDEYTLSELAGEMRTLFLNTLLLSNKTNGDDRDAEGLPAELDALDPTELSFWLMRVFAQHPGKQQLLLEYTSTRERLKRAQEVLQVRDADASGAVWKHAMLCVPRSTPGAHIRPTARACAQETLSYLSATSALKSALKDIGAPPEES